MSHDRVDIAFWTAEFSLSRLRAEARDYVLRRQQERPEEYADDESVDKHIQLMHPKWDIVVGPAAVAVNEQLRAETLAAGGCPGSRVPTDVAVWAKGEPSDRSVTKIGGVPYRPADAPWPVAQTGQPLRFVGQLSFVDSRDIVPPLPGDLLLVFGDDDALVAEPGRLVFEWWPLASGSLVSEAPAVDGALAPFHAALHRTEDWENDIFEGTKIGGVPRFIQEEPSASGAFIGAIGSISVPPDVLHPFINVREPRGWSNENDMMIGDMGSLYLFLGSDGKIEALSQCY